MQEKDLFIFTSLHLTPRVLTCYESWKHVFSLFTLDETMELYLCIGE